MPIPEWDDQPVRIMLEQDAYFDGAAVWYIDGRQTALHLVPRHSHTGPLRPVQEASDMDAR